MEDGGVIVAALGEGAEIVAGLGGVVGVQLDYDCALSMDVSRGMFVSGLIKDTIVVSSTTFCTMFRADQWSVLATVKITPS